MMKNASNFQMLCIVAVIPMNTVLGVGFFFTGVAELIAWNRVSLVYLALSALSCCNLVSIFSLMKAGE